MIDLTARPAPAWYPIMVAAALIWSTTKRARAKGWPDPPKPARLWWPFVALAKSLDLTPAQLCADDPTYDRAKHERACSLFTTAWTDAGEPEVGKQALAVIAAGASWPGPPLRGPGKV